MSRMNPHQRRVLGRIPEEIASYRAGSQTLVQCLNRVWGLFTAAEIHDEAVSDQFITLYNAVSDEDDLLQPMMPPELGSEERLNSTIADLEAWSIDIRDSSDIPGH